MKSQLKQHWRQLSMDLKKIKAELLKKTHRHEALLDNSTETLANLIEQTKTVNDELKKTQLEIDVRKKQIDKLNAVLFADENEIRRLESIQNDKRIRIDSLDSDIKILDSDVFVRLTTLTTNYHAAILNPLNELRNTCDKMFEYASKPIIVESKQQLTNLVNSTHDSTIVINPNNEIPFIIDTSDDKHPSEIKIDAEQHTRSKEDACGCQNGIFTTEYKLQTQVWNDNRNKSEYHLIVKLPSKYIDFVSEENPSEQNELDSVRNVCPVLRWNTVGNLSSKHELNDTITNCKIEEIETGTVDIVSDTKSYELSADFKGSNMIGKTKFTKLNSRNQMWNMIKEGRD